MASPIPPATGTPEKQESVRRHLMAIGFVAAQWSSFEFIIDLCSIILAKIPKNVGHCFTAQISGHARKLDGYMALARLRNGDDFVDELEKLAKEPTALAEHRNRIVHDLVSGIENPNLSRLEVTARRYLRDLDVETPTDDVIALAMRIYAHNGKFQEIHQRILNATRT